MKSLFTLTRLCSFLLLFFFFVFFFFCCYFSPPSDILGNRHWMLYYLVCAMYPRMLMLLDGDAEELASAPVSVRVGQAVDTVAQAGRPKTITGFQTNKSPVLLSLIERAELADEEYLGLSDVMEGLVIIEKNPDYVKPISLADASPAKK